MTQHQCRHSHCSTAPERAPEQPVPCASEPETAKPAQFSAKPQCRYPLHPVKRGAATGHSEGSLPSAVAAQQRPRIDPGTKIDQPKAVKTSRLAVVERNLSQILGEMLPKREMNTRMPPWLVLS